ncbi:ROK family glucokinase [Lachnospiraceae bacterium OttesenSCG-928-D06]|nr:ROK family glucokinase [Lachnospiraceae bacterium OttesenSCG-928-D06]
MGKYAFGADVGGTTVKLGIFSEDGTIVSKWEIKTNTDNEGANILSDVAESIKACMEEKGLQISDVLGVGIGVPGPVDAEGTIFNAVNLGWGKLNIPEAFQKYLNIPVVAANDANAAAFGEMFKGAGVGYKDVIAVTLGTGVGGGIIVNGSILTGAIGAGGEIGHLHMKDDETESCGCGNKGCLEQYASATGIVRLANRRLEKNQDESSLRNVTLSAKSIFDAVKTGDSVAKEVATEFGEYLGKGLSLVASVSNPEIFVIGGGVSNAGDILFDYIRPAFEKYVFSGCRAAQFTLASLGNDAGIYGAAGLVLR